MLKDSQIEMIQRSLDCIKR